LSLSLGLFDVFTYMVPGSLYLSILLFLTDSRHLIHFQSFMGVPSLVLIAGLLIASYLPRLGFGAACPGPDPRGAVPGGQQRRASPEGIC
jgi:hypothetical protein